MTLSLFLCSFRSNVRAPLRALEGHCVSSTSTSRVWDEAGIWLLAMRPPWSNASWWGADGLKSQCKTIWESYAFVVSGKRWCRISSRMRTTTSRWSRVRWVTPPSTTTSSARPGQIGKSSQRRQRSSQPHAFTTSTSMWDETPFLTFNQAYFLGNFMEANWGW